MKTNNNKSSNPCQGLSLQKKYRYKKVLSRTNATSLIINDISLLGSKVGGQLLEPSRRGQGLVVSHGHHPAVIKGC